MYDQIGPRVEDIGASVRFHRGPGCFAAFPIDPDGNDGEVVRLGQQG
jgi:hypothetical protein